MYSPNAQVYPLQQCNTLVIYSHSNNQLMFCSCGIYGVQCTPGPCTQTPQHMHDMYYCFISSPTETPMKPTTIWIK